MLSNLKPMAAVLYIEKGIGYEKYLRDYAKEKHIRISSPLFVAISLLYKNFCISGIWLLFRTRTAISLSAIPSHFNFFIF